jgi:hypothetical protein
MYRGWSGKKWVRTFGYIFNIAFVAEASSQVSGVPSMI